MRRSATPLLIPSRPIYTPTGNGPAAVRRTVRLTAVSGSSDYFQTTIDFNDKLVMAAGATRVAAFSLSGIYPPQAQVATVGGPNSVTFYAGGSTGLPPITDPIVWCLQGYDAEDNPVGGISFITITPTDSSVVSSVIAAPTVNLMFTAQNLWQSVVYPTGNLTAGSPTVTGLSSTSNLTVGNPIVAADLPPFTTIKSIDSSTQITLDQNATASGSGVTLTCPWNLCPVGNPVRVMIDTFTGTAFDSGSDAARGVLSTDANANVYIASTVGTGYSFVGSSVTSASYHFALTFSTGIAINTLCGGAGSLGLKSPDYAETGGGYAEATIDAVTNFVASTSVVMSPAVTGFDLTSAGDGTYWLNGATDGTATTSHNLTGPTTYLLRDSSGTQHFYGNFYGCVLFSGNQTSPVIEEIHAYLAEQFA